MSVYQNINGTLARMDASDLVQLAAVDTDGILGGTPGVTTNGQTLVDQLAADDVQAQTDIGQIKTDLSDYHVVHSINHLPFHTGAVGSYQFVADTNGYMSCTADDGRGWGYANANEYITLPAGTYKYKAFQKTASTGWHTGFQIFKSDNTAIVNVSLANAITGGSFTLSAETSIGVEYKLGNGAYAFQIVADTEDNTTYHVWYVCMRDGMFPRAEQRVLGAKNVLKIDANTQTINGVTFTVNRDSNGNVLNVTANGTATAVTVLVMGTRTYLQDTYTLSGCPVGGNQGTSYALQIRDTNNNTIIYDEGNGGTRALSGNTEYRAIIRIGNGYTANNLVFYPMLRHASDPDDTYAPYVMTNRELTDKFTNRFVKIAEAAANQTWATQISALNSAYSNLTTAQKMRACISNNEDFADGVFTLAAKNVATFGLVSISGTGEFAIMSIRLSSNKISRLNCPVGGSVTVTDMSSQTNNMKLILYVEN